MAADIGSIVGLVAECEKLVGPVSGLTCRICACRYIHKRFGLQGTFGLAIWCTYDVHAWIICCSLDHPTGFLLG